MPSGHNPILVIYLRFARLYITRLLIYADDVKMYISICYYCKPSNHIITKVNKAYIVSGIKFDIPFRSSRYYQFVYTDFQCNNYASVEPIGICMDFSKLYNVIDIGIEVD